ncbi:MAG: hypothetical protein HQ470_04125 [Methylophilales bacterium]|jgi:hypothetical protein|nr:hypothetical protein [Methylophilales bacterium]
MSKLFFLFLLTNVIAYSQEIKYSDLSNIAKRSGVQYESYHASDGQIYKVGDKITIGVPSTNKEFSFIWTAQTLLDVLAEVPSYYATVSSSGDLSEIKRIYLVGTKRAGFSVEMITKGFNLLSNNYTISFENALKSGEIKGSGMSSDEALMELKKAKEKLELGIITQEQYDAIKTDLIKFIK